jgi:hypothetical protein
VVGLKEVCALILAGGVGAGSVVAVQQAKPPERSAKKAKPKPRPAAQSQPASRAKLEDCPTPVAGGALVPEFPVLLPQGAGSPAGWGGLGGSGGIGPVSPGLQIGTGPTGRLPAPPDPVPGAPVPEPAAWLMMVSGFGLIGLALRRRTPASGAGSGNRTRAISMGG